MEFSGDVDRVLLRVLDRFFGYWTGFSGTGSVLQGLDVVFKGSCTGFSGLLVLHG